MAAQGGHLECLKYAHENGCPWNVNTLTAAIRSDQANCMKYALQNNCPRPVGMGVTAAKHGHLPCLRVALEFGARDGEVCAAAAEHGHLDCLEFAFSEGCPIDDSKITLSAAKNGHLDCLDFALAIGCPLHDDAGAAAASAGHLDCLDLLWQHGYLDLPFPKWLGFSDDIAPPQPDQIERHQVCTESITTEAARNGRVDMLRAAFANGCLHDDKVVRMAAHSGSRKCLQSLIDDKVLFMDESVFTAALLRADVDCVHYLIDIGCPFRYASLAMLDDRPRRSAVWDDEMPPLRETPKLKVPHDFMLQPCLQLALERGWQVDAASVEYVRDNKLFLCHRYLHEEGHMEAPYYEAFTPVSEVEPPSKPESPVFSHNAPETSSYVRESDVSEEDCLFVCRSGNLDSVHFLLAEGAVFCPSSMAAAAEHGHLGCVKLLRKQGCPWDETASSAAARGGHYDVLELMIRHGCPLAPDCAILAAETGCQPCLQLLVEHNADAFHPRLLPLLYGRQIFNAAFVRAHFECVQYLISIGCEVDLSDFEGQLESHTFTPEEMDNELLRCILCIASNGRWVDAHSDACKRFLDSVHEHQFVLCTAFMVRNQWESKWASKAAASTRTELNECFEDWSRACRDDKIDCVTALYDPRAPFDDTALTVAAESGHTHCLRHFHEYLQCSAESAALAAARVGQVDTLRYVVSVDCPHETEDMMRLAAAAPFNSLSCLKYLVEEVGIHLNEDGSVFGAAFMRADLACTSYLLEMSCPFDKFRFVFDPLKPHIIVPHHKDAEFYRCIKLSTEYGCKFSTDLVDYIVFYNFTYCKIYFMALWWDRAQPGGRDVTPMITRERNKMLQMYICVKFARITQR